MGLCGAHLSDLFDCIPDVLVLNPDMVFIEIGTNDFCDYQVLPSDFVHSTFDFMSASTGKDIKYIFFGKFYCVLYLSLVCYILRQAKNGFTI